jgi:Uma2 family endonuclease
MAIAEERLYAPEDLLALSETEGFELVDGRLVEKGMGAESSWTALRLAIRLGEFVDSQELGWLFDAECSYQCFTWDPRTVRKPDISFVGIDRLPSLPTGHIRIAPSLAVEVVSPNDAAEDLQRKTREYLRAGVPLVWVIYPRNRLALVYKGDETLDLNEDSYLDGDSVLPGFRCRLGDILPPLRPVEGEAA